MPTPSKRNGRSPRGNQDRGALSRRGVLKAAMGAALVGPVLVGGRAGAQPGDPSKAFHSSMSLARMAVAAGSVRETRAALEQQLRDNGIDPAPALKNLPAGDAGDSEAIVRLVSLARGHGYVVQLVGPTTRGPGSLDLKVTTPSAARMLQSGHDRTQ